MGQQQSRSQPEGQLPQIDVMSEIFEQNSETESEDRVLNAIRISSIDRAQNQKPQQDMARQNSLNKSESDIMHPDMLRLSIEKSKQKQTENKVELNGILQKQSPNILGSWESRYCTLQDNRFIYHQNEKSQSSKAGILNFDLLSCELNVIEKNKSIQAFRITIHESEKQFVFRSKNKSKNKEWAQILKSAIDSSLGRKYNLTYLAHYYRFWRKDYCSEQKFREISETGDILLMRGIKKSAAIQRALTNEEFDHIAIVLKNIRNQVLLFEANGNIGVGIMPWKTFIRRRYYEKQEIVSYRKLHVERTQELMDEVEDFVHRNMGRKYKFSVKKYLINRSSVNQDKNSYFCSSLVAKLYKNLEVLDENISSTQYLPSSFSENQSIKIRENGKYGSAYLGAQHIIVFEKNFFEKQN